MQLPPQHPIPYISGDTPIISGKVKLTPTMVCQKCEKKTTTLAAPDPFQPSSSTRKIGENKILSNRARQAPYATGSAKGRVNPYGSACTDCKQPAQRTGATRCQKCAYKKGVCAVCGVMVLDISRYKQTAK